MFIRLYASNCKAIDSYKPEQALDTSERIGDLLVFLSEGIKYVYTITQVRCEYPTDGYH